MPDLVIKHPSNKGDSITKANRKEIYAFLDSSDASLGEEVAVRVVGRLRNHKTRAKFSLLLAEFNSELSGAGSPWRAKRIRVRFVQEGEFTQEELCDHDRRGGLYYYKYGWLEIVFGLCGLHDL